MIADAKIDTNSPPFSGETANHDERTMAPEEVDRLASDFTFPGVIVR